MTAMLAPEQAVALATDVVLYGNELSRTSHDQAGALARSILAWAPVVDAAGPLADALAVMWEADPTRRPDGGPAVDFVAAYRAAGGDA